jgi:ech hydrogenase subunit D
MPIASLETIEPGTLLERVRRFRTENFRLVQVSGTRIGDTLELTYSFDRDGTLENLRLPLAGPEPRIPSISSVFWCAFLYENELHDLFELQVEGMAVDFKGTLYTTSVKFPFGSRKVPVTASAAPKQPVPASGSTKPGNL